jgi:PAS domain S-box-containing protein/diguanylate cyclase (GGDEF)-like protein
MSSFHDPEIYRSILESLPTGLCVVDREKKIVLWSNGAERITGYRRYEVIGHPCVGGVVLHCGQAECAACKEEGPLTRAIKTARPATASGSLHHKDGHEIPVRIRAVPVHDARGSIIGALETFDDQESAVSSDHREDGLNLPSCMDVATGVASHLMMQSHLRETLGTFIEVDVPFGLLCFRLDGLDLFRAKFGAEAAASLLWVVARTLEGTLWKTDFVGRWSDDQFLVILNGCREETLQSVRERVRRMLANDSIEWWGERRSLPVSIGQATAQAGDSIATLMERAQKSLGAAPPQRSLAAGAAGGTTSES